MTTILTSQQLKQKAKWIATEKDDHYYIFATTKT